MPTSNELLRRYVTSGDAAAFTSLAREHGGMVYATCLRVLRNPADAEDVTQDCFMELMRKANEVSVSVSGWLHGVALRKSLHKARTTRRRQKHEAAIPPPPPPNEAPSWEELRPVIDDAIAALPEGMRHALVLHLLEGKTQAEVAAELGMSQPTVSRRVEEAIQQVRGRLRKSEILVGAAALCGMCAREAAASAVPKAVLAATAKMAISGVGSSAAAQAAAAPVIGGIIVKKIVFAVAVLLIAAAIGFGITRSRNTNQPTPANSKGHATSQEPNVESAPVAVEDPGVATVSESEATGVTLDDAAKREACIASIKELTLPIEDYMRRQKPPVYPATLEIEIIKRHCPKYALQCAGEGNPTSPPDYRFIGPVCALHLGPECPILYDKKGNHEGGRHVLYFDSHIEWVPEEDFGKMLARHYDGLKETFDWVRDKQHRIDWAQGYESGLVRETWLMPPEAKAMAIIDAFFNDQDVPEDP